MIPNSVPKKKGSKLIRAIARAVRDAMATPLLVDDAAGARMLALSRTSFRKLVSAGELPPPVKLSSLCRRVLWRVADLQSHISGLGAT